MGIHGLGKFLLQKAPASVEQVAAEAFLASTVAIDASTSLYAFMIAIRDSENFNNLTNSAGESTSHLAGMLTRAVRILELGMKPIYVFDGKPPTLKSGELAKRRDRKAAAQAEMEEAKERGDEERVRQLAGRTVRVSKKENEEVKKLLRLMGIPILEAPGEAESQCAYLCRAKIADAVVSEDADALCFGAPKLVRGLNFTDKNKGQVTCITLDAVLRDLELNFEQFIQFCILCGCDYSESLRGVGPHTAFKWIQKHGSIKDAFANNDVDWRELKARAHAATPVVENDGSDGECKTEPSEVKTEPGIVKTEEEEEEEEETEQQPAQAAQGASCVIDGRTVQITPSFAFEEALELFVRPDVVGEQELKQMNFEPGDLQEEALFEFLVKENQFNETRVNNAIARLKAARRLGAQTRLDAFFKPQAKAPAAKAPTAKGQQAKGQQAKAPPAKSLTGKRPPPGAAKKAAKKRKTVA